LLESKVDGQFYGILDQMKNELAANAFPTDMIGNIQKEYEAVKSAKRSQLLSNYLN
jgi:hypothetical protein